MSYQQEKFKEIADKIREKTGETENIKPADFKDKLEVVYESGKEAERREMWNKRMEILLNTGWNYAFAGRTWNDETFTPYTDIAMKAGYNIMGFFANTGFTDLKGIFEKYNTTLDLSKGANSTNLFSSSAVTRIPKLILTAASSINTAFSNCVDLVSIDELSIPKVTSATNAFQNCTSLTEIRISGEIKVSLDLHWSPLSKESIESIVSALSDTASGQAVTFNEAQIETLNGETNWWNELKATKPNWSFALLDV